MTESALVVDADLSIRTGTAEAHLGGSGSSLTFETADLAQFLVPTPGVDRRVLRRASSRLGRSGVTISVIEDGVTILDIGAVRPSLIAFALGYRNLRLRRPLRLLVRYLQR